MVSAEIEQSAHVLIESLNPDPLTDDRNIGPMNAGSHRSIVTLYTRKRGSHA